MSTYGGSAKSLAAFLGYNGCGHRFDARKQPEAHQTHFRQPIFEAGCETSETVFDAAAQIDGGGLGEIFRRAAYFGNGEAVPEDLRQHLVVENEIIRVVRKMELFENLAGKGAIAGVIFGKLRAEQDILEQGEEAISQIFPQRHATL